MSSARRAVRVDRNQPDVVKALRQEGLSVTPIHKVGDGCPDLLIGCDGWNFLVELKSEPSSTLTPAELRWFEEWGGQAAVAHTVPMILIAIAERLRLVESPDIKRKAVVLFERARVLTNEMEKA